MSRLRPQMTTPTKTIAEAVREIGGRGYTPELLAYWAQRIRASIQQTPRREASVMARAAMDAMYRKAIGRDLIKHHAGISRFTVESMQPNLRPLLRARIFAAADLIKLNREQAMEVTLHRFAGWATSHPAGAPLDQVEVRKHIGKRLQSSIYEDRRMLIDQGHKLLAAVNQTIAEGAGAIAAQWHHVHEANYDARPEHVARDGRIYLLRDSWAHKDGLIKPGRWGYSDEITQPAQEPYCRCTFTFLYSLSRIPTDLLTEKGRKVMEQTRLRVV